LKTDDLIYFGKKAAKKANPIWRILRMVSYTKISSQMLKFSFRFRGLSMRLLLVEDDLAISDLLRRQLIQERYVVDTAHTLAEARAAIAVADYSLIILDRRLPDGDGLNLVAETDFQTSNPPIIALTAASLPSEKIRGLDAGFDDYICKPYDPDELMARIRAVMRRRLDQPALSMICGKLVYEAQSRRFLCNDTPLRLKRREYAVLESLMVRARRVVRRETLLNETYGFSDDFESNTLDAHISRLRKRLRILGAGIEIHTVRGVGYMIAELKV
jgi:DNA-binding response OmpR family regulator